MPELRIHLFGRFQLLYDTSSLSEFPTHRAKALFAMLVLQAGQLLPRARLMDVLWPEVDESQARKCLSTELWRMRSLLKTGGIRPECLIFTGREGVRFDNEAPYWLDVEAFETALTTAKNATLERLLPGHVRALQDAVDLYRGDLLEGVYDDWCLLQREALAAQYLWALEMLMRWHFAREQWGAAITWGQKLLVRDPFLENVHRSIMRCYLKLGNRSAAVRQYKSCVEGLRRELGVEPMEETVNLYRSICGMQSRPEIVAEGAMPAALAAPFLPIELALERVQRARRCLAQASRLLTQEAARARNRNQ